MLEDDRLHDLTVVDASAVNVCYHRSCPTGRVVGCHKSKKQ